MDNLKKLRAFVLLRPFRFGNFDKTKPSKPKKHKVSLAEARKLALNLGVRVRV